MGLETRVGKFSARPAGTTGRLTSYFIKVYINPIRGREQACAERPSSQPADSLRMISLQHKASFRTVRLNSPALAGSFCPPSPRQRHVEDRKCLAHKPGGTVRFSPCRSRLYSNATHEPGSTSTSAGDHLD